MSTWLGTPNVDWQGLPLFSQDERERAEACVRHFCMNSKEYAAAIVLDICNQNERAAISIVCQAYRAVVPHAAHKIASKAIESVENWLANDKSLDQCRDAISGLKVDLESDDIITAAYFACDAAICVHMHEQDKFSMYRRAVSPVGLAMHHLVVAKSIADFNDYYEQSLSSLKLLNLYNQPILFTPELKARKQTLNMASKAMQEVIAAAVPQAMSVAAKWNERTSKRDE